MRKGLLCFGFVVAAVSATACGGGSNNGSQDMDRTLSTEDLSGTGGDMAMPGTATPENEPANMRTNDTKATAQTITPGETINGTVGDVDAMDNPDVDFYKFTAQAGDVFRITLTARGDYQAFAQILDEPDTETYIRSSNSQGGATSTRQFYIPADGNYFLLVTDWRNVIAQDATELVGGAAFTYSVKIEKQTVTPSSITLPVANQAGMLSADNDVKIFSFTAAAAKAYLARIAAASLTPASDIDSIVLVMDASGAKPVLVAQNDDVAQGNSDSQVLARVNNAGTHHVVVDHFDVTGATKTFQLSVNEQDPNAELEPNNDDTTASTVTTPALNATTTVTGTIDSGTATQNGDIDVWKVTAAAGDYFEITLAPAASSQFSGAMQWVDPAGRSIFFNPNKDAASSVRLEAYAFAAGDHFIYVGDRRNLVAGTPVGGANYGYTMAVKKVTRSVSALGASPVTAANQAKITQGGQTLWWTFTVSGNKLGWIDLDLSSVAGDSGFELNPRMTLVGTDGNTFVSTGNRLLMRDVPLKTGTYTLAISDIDGRFTASGSTRAMKPRITLTDLNAITDNGTHTAQGTALALPGAPAIVDSNLTAGGQIWYSLGTLAVGDGVTVLTQAGAAGTAVDTKITILDGTGATVATHDDTADSEFARLERVRIVTAGEHFVKLEGGLSSSAGAFQLISLKDVCPAPAAAATTDLTINEVFTQPGSSGGDANGDTTSSPINDEFVELLNPTRKTAALGGLLLRDGAGVRYRAACAETITPGLAKAVFGTCSTGGCLQANADPANPRSGGVVTGERLGLDDAGEMVALLSYDGLVIDKVVVGAATQNVSYARGSAAVCDVRPSTPAVQLHNACTAASAGYSPGKKADGTNFTAPPALTNDTCSMGTALTLGVELAGQDTTTFADDHEIGGGAMCAFPTGIANYDGFDAAFRVTVGAGKTLTVTVTPIGAWDPAVAIVTDCAMVTNSCVALKDDGFDGEAETVMYTNTGAQRDLFIIVDSYTPTSYGEFKILATSN